MTWFDPHHDGSASYLEIGPSGVGPRPQPAIGDTVTMRVRVPRLPDGSSGANQVVLRAVQDGEPYAKRASMERTDEGGDWWRVSLQLTNPLTSYRFLVVGQGAPYRWLNASGNHRRDVTDAHDFKISTTHSVPDWVADQIGYQVFPDRFARTPGVGPEAKNLRRLPAWAKAAGWNDPVEYSGPDVPGQIFGGTLDGISTRLDNISDLGANLLYLTPFFAARSNHRYDATSFDAVDPLLGGDAALRRLIKAVHSRGMRVVGDLTTNHTGDAHEWFLAAQRDPASVERGFYRFYGDGSYASWLNIPSLPKLDHSSSELASRLYDGPQSVVAKWIKGGLDGWRIDVANMTGRLGADDQAHEVASTIRRTLAAANPDAYLLAEHGHDASLDLGGPGWHGTMDYAGFTRPVWAWLNGGAERGPGIPHGLDWLGLPIALPTLSGQAIVTTMRDVHASMPWSAWQASTMHLDSHDTPRFRTVTGGGVSGWTDTDGEGLERHIVGLAMQMTMPGVPVVFAGDEIGLTGVNGEHSRTPYPWDRENEWDHWTLAAYREWIALRRDNIALRRGSMRWVNVEADSITYLREHPQQTLLVHLTRAPGARVILPAEPLNPHGRIGKIELVAATGTGRRNLMAGGRDPRVILPGHGPAAYVYQLY